MTRLTDRAILKTTTALRAFVLCALVGALVLPTGCKKEEPPPPPAPAPPPPPPPPPEPVDIDPLLQSMDADARVQFPQAMAPVDEQLARSIISFATALASGDSDTMGSMLTADSKPVLDELVTSGAWYDATDSIEAVRVVQLVDSSSVAGDIDAILTFAIQDPDGAYLLSWGAQRAGSGFRFGASQSSDEVRSRASDFDNNVPLPDMLPTPTSIDLSGEINKALQDAMDQATQGGEPFQEEERDPRRRNTPAGPITVPGGG